MAVEPAVGAPAGFTDDDYRAAGAAVTDDALDDAQAMQCVQAPAATQVKRLGAEAITVSFLPTAKGSRAGFACRGHRPYRVRHGAGAAGVPAQAMDALSS